MNTLNCVCGAEDDDDDDVAAGSSGEGPMRCTLRSDSNTAASEY